MRKKKVPIDLNLNRQTVAYLESIAKQGILGTTVEEVALHILKNKLYELDTDFRARQSALFVRNLQFGNKTSDK